MSQRMAFLTKVKCSSSEWPQVSVLSYFQEQPQGRSLEISLHSFVFYLFSSWLEYSFVLLQIWNLEMYHTLFKKKKKNLYGRGLAIKKLVQTKKERKCLSGFIKKVIQEVSFS